MHVFFLKIVFMFEYKCKLSASSNISACTFVCGYTVNEGDCGAVGITEHPGAFFVMDGSRFRGYKACK